MKHLLPAKHADFYNAFEKLQDPLVKDGGIYILKTNLSVQRVLKLDSIGVLYIGKGLILSKTSSRVGQIVNSINGTDTSHDAGVRYKKLLEKKFPIETMTIEFEFVENRREVEKGLLKNYLAEFGEYPPLNRVS